jgi:hypothetical protein
LANFDAFGTSPLSFFVCFGPAPFFCSFRACNDSLSAPSRILYYIVCNSFSFVRYPGLAGTCGAPGQISLQFATDQQFGIRSRRPTQVARTLITDTAACGLRSIRFWVRTKQHLATRCVGNDLVRNMQRLAMRCVCNEKTTCQ